MSLSSYKCITGGRRCIKALSTLLLTLELRVVTFDGHELAPEILRSGESGGNRVWKDAAGVEGKFKASTRMEGEGSIGESANAETA
jgi:hypothetical protein